MILLKILIVKSIAYFMFISLSQTKNNQVFKRFIFIHSKNKLEKSIFIMQISKGVCVLFAFECLCLSACVRQLLNMRKKIFNFLFI